jgi:hypothetical protein
MFFGGQTLPSNLSFVKPSLSNLGLYPPNLYLSNLYSLKTLYKNAPICPEIYNKIKKRFG